MDVSAPENIRPSLQIEGFSAEGNFDVRKNLPAVWPTVNAQSGTQFPVCQHTRFSKYTRPTEFVRYANDEGTDFFRLLIVDSVRVRRPHSAGIGTGRNARPFPRRKVTWRGRVGLQRSRAQRWRPASGDAGNRSYLKLVDAELAAGEHFSFGLSRGASRRGLTSTNCFLLHRRGRPSSAVTSTPIGS